MALRFLSFQKVFAVHWSFPLVHCLRRTPGPSLQVFTNHYLLLCAFKDVKNWILFQVKREEIQKKKHTTSSLVADILEKRRTNKNFIFGLLYSLCIFFLKKTNVRIPYVFISEYNNSHVSYPCSHSHVTDWTVNPCC